MSELFQYHLRLLEALLFASENPIPEKVIADRLPEEAAEGLRGHAGDIGRLWLGQPAMIVLVDKGADPVDPPEIQLPVRWNEGGTCQLPSAAARQPLQNAKQAEQTLQPILLFHPEHCRSGLVPLAGFEMQPTGRAFQQLRNSLHLRRGAEILTEEVPGEMYHDRLVPGAFGRGRIRQPGVRQVRPQQHQVAGVIGFVRIPHEARSARFKDEGQLVFRMEVPLEGKSRGSFHPEGERCLPGAGNFLCAGSHSCIALQTCI